MREIKFSLFIFVISGLFFFGCEEEKVINNPSTDPVVSIVSPGHGEHVYDLMEIEAVAEDNLGAIKVDFFFDQVGKLLSVDDFVFFIHADSSNKLLTCSGV